MIARYLTPEMRRLWSEEHKFRTWLRVEQAVAAAQARLGIIPRHAARRIRQARFTLRQIERFEAETRHDVIAFLRSVESSIGRDFPYLHFGLTSYDVVDTALALRCREALDLIDAEIIRLIAVLRGLARRHQRTPMMGRTHGVHAEPITFGLKALSWHEEISRSRERLQCARRAISFGKLSGAVGTLSHQTPRVEILALRALGLRPEPVATQVIPRDRLAEMMAACAILAAGLERIAQEIRNLQRTEIAELAESFAPGQRGSSAMPHKKNPISCEQICGLARIIRANLLVALENVPLWHERDLTNSSAERVIIPDSLGLIHYLLRRTAEVLDTLQVDSERMLVNLASARGQHFSQRLMLELVRAGMGKDQAYRIAQELSFRARDAGRDLAELARTDPRVLKRLDPEQLDQALQLSGLLGNVDRIFARALRQRRRSS
jgi:adenylosuccinate lyase